MQEIINILSKELKVEVVMSFFLRNITNNAIISKIINKFKNYFLLKFIILIQLLLSLIKFLHLLWSKLLSYLIILKLNQHYQ